MAQIKASRGFEVNFLAALYGLLLITALLLVVALMIRWQRGEDRLGVGGQLEGRRPVPWAPGP